MTGSPTPHTQIASPACEVTRRRRGRWRSLLALGTVLGVGALGTSAAFSDSAAVTASFTAGTLDITVDGNHGHPVPYTLDFPGGDVIAPGETVHAALEVANIGNVDALLSLAVAATLDGSPSNATSDLRVVVAHATGNSCDATVVAADPTPYSPDGPLGSAGFSGVALDGGDHVDLCFAVTLPLSVTGTGGGSTTLDLAFTAEQAAV
jgi:predicted ribosomally synthesized peptide with SipW-like signal peptide